MNCKVYVMAFIDFSPRGLSSAIGFYNDTLEDIVEKHAPKKSRVVTVWADKPCSLLASLYNPIVNPAMVSTVRFYDRNELYGSPDVRNCRVTNFLGWAFFVISLISIN